MYRILHTEKDKIEGERDFKKEYFLSLKTRFRLKLFVKMSNIIKAKTFLLIIRPNMVFHFWPYQAILGLTLAPGLVLRSHSCVFRIWNAGIKRRLAACKACTIAPASNSGFKFFFL